MKTIPSTSTIRKVETFSRFVALVSVIVAAIMIVVLFPMIIGSLVGSSALYLVSYVAAYLWVFGFGGYEAIFNTIGKPVNKAAIYVGFFAVDVYSKIRGLFTKPDFEVIG